MSYKGLALLLLISQLSFGCADDVPDVLTITAIEISPRELAQSDTGMTDEFFTVHIQIAGFTHEMDWEASRVFFVAGAEEIDGIYQTASKGGDTITLENIATSWFQGQPVGTYEIGASVQTVADSSGRPAESATDVGLAEVTIVE